MENKYYQFLKDYPQKLAKALESTVAFQQALEYAKEHGKDLDEDFAIKRLEISSVGITITLSLNTTIPTNQDYNISIPAESHSF